jgi:hypothetical protein
VAELTAELVVIEIPGTNGVPLTWVKSIQDVMAKKLESWN